MRVNQKFTNVNEEMLKNNKNIFNLDDDVSNTNIFPNSQLTDVSNSNETPPEMITMDSLDGPPDPKAKKFLEDWDKRNSQRTPPRARPPTRKIKPPVITDYVAPTQKPIEKHHDVLKLTYHASDIINKFAAFDRLVGELRDMKMLMTTQQNKIQLLEEDRDKLNKKINELMSDEPKTKRVKRDLDRNVDYTLTNFNPIKHKYEDKFMLLSDHPSLRLPYCFTKDTHKFVYILRVRKEGTLRFMDVYATPIVDIEGKSADQIMLDSNPNCVFHYKICSFVGCYRSLDARTSHHCQLHSSHRS